MFGPPYCLLSIEPPTIKSPPVTVIVKNLYPLPFINTPIYAILAKYQPPIYALLAKYQSPIYAILAKYQPPIYAILAKCLPPSLL